MIRLRRCPFCGGTAIFVAEGAIRDYVHVSCGRCGARTSSEYTEEEAAKNWNCRDNDFYE